MTSPMNLMPRRIVDYEGVEDFELEKRAKTWCPETMDMLSRSTAIFGVNARRFTDSRVHRDGFFIKHSPSPSCMCDGHKCLRIHAALTLLSLLSVFNIDPETNI
jgi:hypothetical protein